MTDQKTSLQNAFVTQLTSEMTPISLTASVASIGNLTSPCYLVIDMDDDALREYILFDGTFGASTFTATNINKRYLTGSAAASNLTHAIGATVQAIAMSQHFDDLNDRIDAMDHDDLVGLADDDHTQYYNQTRGDARYAKIASARFTLPFASGDKELEVTLNADSGRWKAPFACTLVSATACCGVAPTGADVVVDVHKDDTTMFSTKPKIVATNKDGARQTPSVTTIALGNVLTVMVDQIGSTLPGENLVVTLEIEVP